MEESIRTDMSGIDFINEIVKPAEKDKRLRIMENCDGVLANPIPFLGYTDAIGEWSGNPELAHDLFLHTQSYHTFIRRSSLILLGRIGTGKTAILQCLKEDVNSDLERTYKRSIYISFDPLLRKLQKSTENIQRDNDSSDELIDVLELYIRIVIMKDMEANPDFNSAKIPRIKRYLHESGAETQDVLEIISMCLDELRPEGTTIPVDMAYFLKDLAIAIRRRLKSNSFDDAVTELEDILSLNEYDYLVLVDSADVYQLKDAVVIATIKALITVCFNRYLEASKKHIYLKMAIPSEVYTTIFEELPGKRQGNTVVIQWTNNESRRMVALRLVHLYSLCKQGQSRDGFELPIHRQILNCFEDYSDKKLYYEKYSESINNAKRLLDLFLPERTPTSLSFSVDTFGYILHHTLKKPREALLLFNHIIGLIDTKNSIDYFKNNPEEIRTIVHGSQELLVGSALSMYTSTYESIGDVCRNLFSNMSFCFTEDTINRKIRSVVGKKTYDEKDVKRLLLESGLVGEVANVHIGENGIYHIKAKFEYQIKGKLSFVKSMAYVLHPMCYEHYSCQLHEDSLVLPSSLDSADEIINSIIKK